MRTLRRDFPLHLMLVPGVILTLIYAYGPMAGIIMAFQNFEPLSGFFKSKWVGFDNFTYVFHLPDFNQVLWNTLLISIFKMILFLLVPLILALLLNEITKKWFAGLIQSSIFLPFFLSWTVLGGVIIELFSLNGPVNGLISLMGLKPILFMLNNDWFRGIIIGSDVWKGMGYNMIIMLAAITGINMSLYEAAEVDGGGKWKQMLHITLPGLAPMLILLGVLSLGNILNAGFEQILLMYNPTVYQGSDIIDTFVYRLGMFSQQFGPAAAVGLFKSIISLGLVSISYYAAYKYNNYRIF
ncbi:ABC transporter permease subunit [Paenibacillus chondroitinus]|uniref:ABC transporter permease subunit n=1 Tax=Paenibacillus chondroitinus TaxID=59842 RepID=A0ABU6DC46_9BACL|nr:MULTISPECIES: ABC transporter permease subunit [Paenibacillus]MCY9656503.1 ABC transporter permease subunit [Paenibacillus anseongense]MEB4795327.1 ABC transporter permease subunit [Paenibacillus chondroitinus]